MNNPVTYAVINSMINTAAIDLDDTLLRSDGSISPRTLRALSAWRAAGRRIVIATGRPRRSVHTCLPVELHDAPWICYNGAEAHENGQRIYENLIPVAATRTIVERMQAIAVACEIGLEIDNVLYLNRESTRPRAYQVANLLEIADRPSAKVLLFADTLDEFAPLLADLPAEARVLYSARYAFVQILARTADKAEALRTLLPTWGATFANVVAFGDDTNDVDMLRASGLGVAVANAVPEVLQVADQITASNDEDGVALVLEALLAQ
ncbi:MAG: Cof-type HAD-IIB family hydrolase [Chloroflexota bacterium]|nr:Cof-type HAD-IIB family hydrolase [Chloroflexota bacterium]